MAQTKLIDDEAIERPFDRQQFKRLLGYLSPYKKEVFISFCLMVIVAVTSLAGPYLMKIAIDNHISIGRLDGLQWVLLIHVSANAIHAVCQRYRIRIMDRAGRTAIATLRQDLFNHIQTLSFSFFDSKPAGKIMVRVINDVNSLNGLFTDGIVNVLIDFLTLIIIIIIMLTINVKLTLISMSTIPLLLLVTFKLKRKIHHRWQEVRKKSSNMNAYLHESLSGMKVTQAFVREKENENIFLQLNNDIKSTWMDAIKINNLFWPCIDIISTMGTVLIYIFGVRALITGEITVGILLSIIWYSGRFWEPLNNISNFYNSILVAMASTERIFEVLDTKPEIQDSPNAIEMPEIVGRVEFDNVTFSYDDKKMVLEDVSFDIEPGETVALVGPTGAGKSTIVNLISRFYDVTEGEVRIDGHNIKDVKLHSLRKQMGIMMQDTFIFSGTIMDNIRYGRLDATDEEVIEAAKAVHAHDFIMEMENGYYTEVKERGSRLSVGQKQLISFARALLADPKILILDEATSSIDTQTEILIQKALERLLKGRTSFIIAHRLSTIRKVDRIMVIDDRHIIESGNHDELIEKKGMYYGLCQAQYKFLKAV